MSANHFRKRRKESGFCSRVSMMATGSGVRSWVPPHSARTGSWGGGTGAACGDHARGDGIKVRLRGMVSATTRLGWTDQNLPISRAKSAREMGHPRVYCSLLELLFEPGERGF